MAYRYSDEFQGFPCRYDWYQRFSNAVNTGDQECTLIVYDVVDGSLKEVAYLTNLFCTDSITVDGDILPVYILDSVNVSDSIDPLMVSSVIPSFDFSLTFEHITRFYTLAELDAITKNFENKLVKVYRGFFSFTGDLRNDLGTANLSYDQFEHDLECLGLFIIQESKYDYTNKSISCSGESLVFSVLRDSKFYSSDPYWNQRYPYPYNDESYLIGYPADKFLDGSIFGQLNYKGLPLYGKESNVEGLSTYHICNTLWVQPEKTSNDPVETWNEHIFTYNYAPYEGEYQFTQTGQPIDFKTTGVWWQNGDEISSDEWSTFYYIDEDNSGTFNSGDHLLAPIYGGDTEVFTPNSTIYVTDDATKIWDGTSKSFVVRWKSLRGIEPGAIRNFSLYKHDSNTEIESKAGSHYYQDTDGMYYTEAEFEIQEIGLYDIKCWYGTYQFDATITVAISPVSELGGIPAFGGHGDTQEDSYLRYFLVTVYGSPTVEDVETFDLLQSANLDYIYVPYKILGYTEGSPEIPDIPSELASTGKVKNTQIEVQSNSKVQGLIVYGEDVIKNDFALPEGYTEVEYIESTGTQYIDTGISAPNGFSCDLTISFDQIGQMKGIIGSHDVAAPYNRNYLAITVSNGWEIGAFDNDTYGAGQVAQGSKYRVQFCNVSNSIDLVVNGTDMNAEQFATSTARSALSVYILGLHYQNNELPVAAKLYGAKVKAGASGEWAVNLVPCVRDSDGAVGMFDTVNNAFHGNIGTGSFIAGSTISYQEVEYIESSGTQYIDTGFKPSGDTSILCSALFDTVSSSAWLFGTRNSKDVANYGFLSYQNKYRSDYGSGHGTGKNIGSPVIDIVKNKNTTTVNGTDIDSFEYQDFECAYNLLLFANNNGGSPASNCSARIMSCQIYDDGVIVRDFIPVTRNGEAGLYDQVDGVFYGNAGTGSFISGPEIISGMSNVALKLNDYVWNINLYNNELGNDDVLTVNSDGSSDINGASIGIQEIPTFNVEDVIVTTQSDSEHYFNLSYMTPYVPGTPGVDPVAPPDIPLEPGDPAFDFDWSFRSNKLELQKNQDEYITIELMEPTDLTSVPNTFNEETMYDSIVSYCLMNNMHIVPSKSTSETNKLNDGSWMITNGLTPTLYPFRNEDASDDQTNGKYFSNVEDARYRINVAMVLSDGFSKDQLNINDVTHTRETMVNVGRLSGSETDSYDLPVKDRFSSSVDILNGEASPSDALNGYVYDTVLPLSDGTWYDTKNIKVMSGDTELGDLFGTDQSASNLMGGKNYAIRGNSVLAYSVLWNDALNLTKSADQPFSFSIPKYDATEYYVDTDGNTTSEDDELTIVDTNHAYYGYNGLSKRMVDRANGNWLKPLYEIQWGMVDDPSLRVGTLVYVPIHNQYVETYITEQSRSFDGSGSLTCKGWVIRETDEAVLLPEPVNCKGTHYAGDPNDDTKGDFVTFSWEENVGWDGLYGQLVRGRITYEDDSGTNSITLIDQFFTSGEPMEVSFNWFTLQQTIGQTIDTMAENGSFYIELTYYSYEVKGKTKFDYENIIPSNQPFSYLYAGYTVASNEVAPIAFNHYLVG